MMPSWWMCRCRSWMAMRQPERSGPCPGRMCAICRSLPWQPMQWMKIKRPHWRTGWLPISRSRLMWISSYRCWDGIWIRKNKTGHKGMPLGITLWNGQLAIRGCPGYKQWNYVENRIFQAVPLFLYKRFEDPLSLNRDLFYPGLLLFVKTKCQHIAFVQMIEIQIINKLFFTGFVIFFSSP